MKKQKQNNTFFNKANLVINTVLVMATVGMTLITYTSNRISKDSIGIANAALKEAKRANDLAEKNDSISSISLAISDTINRENLKLTKESVTKQIEALKESQKQFEKINKPYLQLRDLLITSIEENKPIKISYTLQNLGSYPAKIIETKIGYFIESKVMTKNVYNPNYKLNTDSTENYIIKEVPFPLTFTSEIECNSYNYINIMNEVQYLHFWGNIIYTNEVSNKKRKCEFNIRLFPPPSRQFKVIYIRNIDIS